MSFPRKITLFHAKNSEGKDQSLGGHLLPLLPLLSPRCSRPQEMIRHGTRGFSIKGRVEDQDRGKGAHRLFWGRERRTLDGGKEDQPAGQVLGNRLAAVMFSPDDMALIAEAHELRRRFLDRCARPGGCGIPPGNGEAPQDSDSAKSSPEIAGQATIALLG